MEDRDETPDGERGLLERLVVALERHVEQDSAPRKPAHDWERFITPVTVLLSALGLGVTIWYSQNQLSTSSQQFDRTMRQSQYADIVDGMASSSVAVQVNSVRRLVQYVREDDNFDNHTDQGRAAVNAAQTLAAFIEDESAHPGSEGLTDYRDPQPVVVGRALDQLVALTDLDEEDKAQGDTAFPSVAVDLSRGNFHGVPAADFSPHGSFIAVGADFRVASVAGWDLTAVPAPDLRSAFFTCADLQTSDLGTADVAGADFTGANLRGADLASVQNLTRAQLDGALTGPLTQLPGDIKDVPDPGWGIDEADGRFRASPACRHLVERMTGLLPGAGFSSRLPCPHTPAAAEAEFPVRLSHEEQTSLRRVCRLRVTLGRP